MVVLSLTLLVGSIQLLPASLSSSKKPRIFEKKYMVLYLGLMALMILGIFHVVPFVLSASIVAFVVYFFFQKELFRSVDYRLLVTFACFFVIIGNINEQDKLIEMIQPFFQKNNKPF